MQIMITAAALALLAVCALLIVLRKKITSDNEGINKKLRSLETLLLDIRDGTHNYYMEKRVSPRVTDYIVAKVSGDNSGKFIDILNISYTGALLRTQKTYKVDEKMEMSIHLPLLSDPIKVSARVVKATQVEDALGKSKEFNIGVVFIDLAHQDREKLVETVDILRKKDLA